MPGAKVAGLGAMMLMAVACGHAARQDGRPAANASAAGSDKARVLVGPDALENGDAVLAAWVGYGAAKARTADAHPPPAANGSADDFATELAGRQAQCAFWIERRAKGAAPFPELDRQAEICKAGFLPELVVSLQARPGWTVPGRAVSSLRLMEFVTRFAGEYRPGAPVTVVARSGKRFPDVPGADFPDPARLPMTPASCGAELEARQAAWRRWESLAPTLGGLPIGATSAPHFGRQLIAIKGDPQHAARGATWVSQRVAHLALLEGFCAVEHKDWPRAAPALARAAALDPSNPMPRLELALALTMLRKLDEALGEVDQALGVTDDACTVALGWRRRGYILIEQGALEAARFAYEKSLTLEPDSSIARSELATIAASIQQHGGMHERGAFTPPPPEAKVTLTRCRRGGQAATQ